MKRAGAWLSAVALVAPAFGAESYSFDVSRFEKQPFELGGYMELKVEQFRLNRGAALYELNFADRQRRATLDRRSATLKLDAKARAGDWLLSSRIHADAIHDQLAHGSEQRFDELFASWKASAGVSVDAGKTVLKWGKGYAWNPVGFVERSKDPNDPELAREGFTMLKADFVRSFQGPLTTVAFTPLLLPVSHEVNSDYGRTGHVNVAAKLYLLYQDTDFDFYYLGGGSRSRRYGADFSRNLGSNLVIHGEWARIGAQEFPVLDGADNVLRRTQSVNSWLIGLRYLTALDTTYILELYRNGAGFSADEFRAFSSLVERAALAGPQTPLWNRARGLQQAYGRPNPLRDYLYLRISQKEPFDLLYFTVALTSIVSLEDRSYSIAPELLYAGRGNLELRARAIFLNGGRGSDFGEKQNERRLELQARLFF